MFYQPGKEHHGLPRDPFKSCVVPRPIGWISTLNKSGVPNLAPFSQFQNLNFDPPYVMFSANKDLRPSREVQGFKKDSVYNAEMSGEFVWNMATYDLREQVNLSAAAHHPSVDEFEVCGLTKVKSELVKPFRISESPVQFECKYIQTVNLPSDTFGGPVDIVIGQVIGIHIKEEALTNGLIDIVKIKPLARCGYKQYTYITEVFEMTIPTVEGEDDPKNGNLNLGLEGDIWRGKTRPIKQGEPI